MCPASYDLIRGHMLLFYFKSPEFKAEVLLLSLLIICGSFLKPHFHKCLWSMKNCCPTTFRETFLFKEHSLLLKMQFKALGEGQDCLLHMLSTNLTELLCLKLMI